MRVRVRNKGIEEGQILTVEFLGGSVLRPFSVKCVVVNVRIHQLNSEAVQVGLKFLDIGKGSRSAILDYLYCSKK